jgi:hypothetical protein
LLGPDERLVDDPAALGQILSRSGVSPRRPSSSTATSSTGEQPWPSGCCMPLATATCASWTAAAISGWLRDAQPR